MKQVRTTILEPAEQISILTPADKRAVDAMLAFHRESRAAYMELEASCSFKRPLHFDVQMLMQLTPYGSVS